MRAWARAGYDAYWMDRELELGIDWVEIRREHMNFSARYDAPAHAPRPRTRRPRHAGSLDK
eukprot:113876-Pyramimonas_sp.AAC.1